MKLDPKTRGDRAVSLFLSGYNCAQSVFGAFTDLTGLDFGLAMRLSSSFGGGIGRMRETCGAFSAMAMLAGILCGYEGTGENGEKAALYAKIQALAASFRERCGSLLCRELLFGLGKDDSPTPEARTPDYYRTRPCARYIRTAAELISAFLNEERGPSHEANHG